MALECNPLIHGVLDQAGECLRHAAVASEDMTLRRERYGYGISWTTGAGKEVDLDLQCVVVDTNGIIIDCAYYNNLKAGPGVTHSGDEIAGSSQGVQEIVWITLRRVTAKAALFIFVVAAHTGGTLQDIVNGHLHVLEDKENREIAVFPISRARASVNIVAAMCKDATSGLDCWKLRRLDQIVDRGQHFMDVLPHLADTIRMFIPLAPKKQKVAFAMEKGGVLDLPMDLGRITVGLGWDVDEGEVDLDVSAVLLDRQGQYLEAVFFGRLESEEHGILHTGDNLTGEGDGDDERIQVCLDRIGPQVQQVVFVVNIYTPQKTFLQVASPYCRVIDDSSGSELCRYSLREAGGDVGLIVSKIVREAEGRWSFHALGLPCRGRTYKDSLPQIHANFNTKTQSLLLRSGSSGNLCTASAPTTLAKEAWGTPVKTVSHAPATPVKTTCCALQ